MFELVGLAVVAAVAGFVVTLTADLRAKRTLARVARTNIIDAVDGEWVKVVGTVRRDDGVLLIQDETARARIDAQDLVGLVSDTYERVGMWYVEKLLDQRVAVFGWASWEADATGDYRGSGKRLVLRGTKRAPVVVSFDARFLDS
jgi:hypothetical protein